MTSERTAEIEGELVEKLKDMKIGEFDTKHGFHQRQTLGSVLTYPELERLADSLCALLGREKVIARIDEVGGIKALYADISLDYPLEKRGKAFSDVTFDRIAELRS